MRCSLYVLALVLGCLFVLVGCGTVKRSLSDYEACKADPSCLAEMYRISNSTRAIVSNGVSLLPGSAGLDSVLGSVAGMLSFGLAGLVYGRKYASKK